MIMMQSQPNTALMSLLTFSRWMNAPPGASSFADGKPASKHGVEQNRSREKGSRHKEQTCKLKFAGQSLQLSSFLGRFFAVAVCIDPAEMTAGDAADCPTSISNHLKK